MPIDNQAFRWVRITSRKYGKYCCDNPFYIIHLHPLLVFIVASYTDPHKKQTAEPGVDLKTTILSSRVDYGRRKVSRPPVSRSPSPNRACVFRYALGSPETMA